MKKFLQLMLLAALMVPFGVRAQGDSLTACVSGNLITKANADTATSSQSYIPGYSYYNYAYSEVIVPGDRMSGIGTIKAMQFKPASTSAGSYFTNCEIYLANVSEDDLSDGFIQDTTRMQLVWSGDMSYTTTDWKTIVFDTTFFYDGVSNLLVAVRRNHGSYTNGSSFVSFSATEQLGRYVYQDDGAYTIGSITGGSATTNVPWYKFIGCDDAATISCNRVTNLHVDNITLTGATLRWSDDMNASATYTVYNMADNSVIATGIADTFYTITTFNASSPYRVAVTADCGIDDTAVAAIVSFRTACGSIATLPWSAGFESDEPYEVPFCWTLTTPYGYLSYYGDTNYGPYAYQTSYSAHSGAQALYHYIYGYYGLANNYSLIASPYIVHNPADLHVTFWVYTSSFNDEDTVQAGIMTDPDADSTFIPMLTLAGESGYYPGYRQYEFYTNSLTDFNDGDSVCVAFRVVKGDQGTYMTVYLDDIAVDAMGDCLAPTLNSGSVDSVSYEGVQLSWQTAGDATNFDVVLVTGNNTLTHYPADDTTILIENGLTPNTYYQAYAASICDGDTTSYTLIGSFTTHYRCYAVVDPTVAALTANAAALTWSFTGTGIEPTDVEVVLMDLTDSTTTTLHLTDDNCIFSGLTEGHMYEATFVTYCGDDTSWSVSVNFMPHTAPCAEFSGSSSNQYIPFYSFYNNGFSEMLYSGTDFAGFDSVTGLSFEVANTLNRTNTIDIWMGYVSDSITGLTAATYIPVDSMVHVVSNYSFSTATSGWMDMIPFDTLFPTQPTGNVVIAVYNHTGSYSSGLRWASHTSTVGSSVYGYTDYTIDLSDPFGSISSYSQNTSSEAANVQFYGNCGGGDCVAPGARVVSSDTTSVTLTWLPGGSESSWNVLYREADATTWINLGAANTVPFTVDSLNPGTDYQFRVGSDCGDTIAYGNAITGTTACGYMHAPFTIIPNGENNCWTYSGGYYYYSYSSYIYFYYGGSVMTPAIADSINTLQVRLHVYGAPYYVGVCDADGQNITWMDTVVPNDDYVFEYKKSYLHHYTGTGDHIIIRSGNGYVYLDQITVEPLDDCMPVENLSVDSVTTTDAWLSWTSDGENFLVQYMDENDSTNTWMSATSTTNNIHLTGMNSNTRYQVKVFNVCDTNSQSDSVTIRVIMGCVPYTTPFREQFGQEELPVCWNNVTSGTRYTTFAQTAGYGYNYVYSYGPYSGNGQYDWLMTPEIQVPVDAENYRFLYLIGGGSYPYSGYPNSLGAYDLYISTTGSGDTSLYTTLLLSDTLNSRTSSTTYVNPASVSLTPYAGQTVSLAFRARTREYGAVYIMDVEARFAGEPRYYLSGNGVAFTGENNTYVANYLEGALDSMTYQWTSTMAAAGHAVVTGANTDTMHIVYNTPGADTLMFVASNQFGSDTNYGVVYVYQCDVITEYPWVEDFEESGALACWRQEGDAEWEVGTGDYSSATGSHSGTGNALITHTDRGAVTKLITPVLNLAGTPTATLSFWHIQRVWSGDQDELNIYYRNNLDSAWTLLTSFTDDIQTWTLDTVVLPNTSATYQIAFEMVDDYGYGVAIDSVVVMGLAAGCAEPVVDSIVRGEDNLVINFTSEADSTELTISLGTNVLETAVVAGGSYTFSGLSHSTVYSIALRALCSADDMSEWTVVTDSTIMVNCGTPSDITVEATTYTSATINWTAGGEETAWGIRACTTTDTLSFTATTKPYTMTGLTSGVTYNVQVRALCGQNSNIEGEWSAPAQVTTDVCATVDAGSVAVNDITADGATVSWAPAQGSIGYVLYYADHAGFTFDEARRVNVTDGTSHTFSGLEEETTYELIVFNRCTETLTSNQTDNDRVQFTTLAGGSEGIYDVENGTLTLFPNPASSVVTVTVSGFDGEVEVQIVDMNGRTVSDFRTQNSELTLDVSELTQGAYFVRVTGDKSTAVRKLIVR